MKPFNHQMKSRSGTMTLVVVMVGLFCTSCVSVRSHPQVAPKETCTMPPFDATVEHVFISHPFFVQTEISIILRKAQGGNRISLHYYPATKYGIDFAHFLKVGQRYSFPQVWLDFDNINSQQTNNVLKRGNS